jgi:predicted AAA+ superfamily ATPase
MELNKKIRIYVLDKLDPSFFYDYPITIALMEAGKQDVYLDTHLYKERGEVINTITDEETLQWIERECRTTLEKPRQRVEVKIGKNDIGVIVIKRGKDKYDVYELTI